MGRELKRVPLDFKWPIDQLWKGYVNPYRCMDCKACDQTGYNPATKRISDGWYSFDKVKYVYLSSDKRYNDLAWSNHITQDEVEALVRAGRLYDLMPVRCYYDEDTNKWIGWLNREKVEIEQPAFPTVESVNEWNRKGMGHDAINRGICIEVRAKRLGVYGKCEYCNGEGVLWTSDELKELHENWVGFDPPAGDGYQLWSTTSEGHPMTPVFKTLEDLCEFCEKENISVFGHSVTTKQRWYEMLSDGHVYHQEGNNVFL